MAYNFDCNVKTEGQAVTSPVELVDLDHRNCT